MNQKTGLIISGILTAIGLIGAFTLLIKGHGVMGTSPQLPWGILIAAYDFFVLIGLGLCLISSLGCVFGIDPFAAVSKRLVVLSMITLMAGLLLMGLETPQPLHMIYMLISPNFSAAIFWMGGLYGAFLFSIAVEFWCMTNGSQSKIRFFGLLSFFLALIASSNVGAVFGVLHARPYWEGAFMPMYFVIAAFLSGSAAFIVLYYLLEDRDSASPILPAAGKLMTLFLSITLLFTIWKMLTGLYGHIPGKTEAYSALLSGPYALNFWCLEIGIGIIVPLFLQLINRTRKVTFIAAVMSMAGIFFMRYDLVMVGQIVPLDVIDQSPLPVTYLSYSATWVEWAVVSLGFGFTSLAYIFAEKRLNLDMPNVAEMQEEKVSEAEPIG